MPTLKLIRQAERCPLPTISLRIAGAECYFIIDTGAETTFLSPRLKPQLNWKQEVLTRNQHSIGFGGKSITERIPVKFTLIGISISHVCFDNSIDMLAKTGLNIHGIIGQDILQQFNSVEFCWREGVVRFK